MSDAMTLMLARGLAAGLLLAGQAAAAPVAELTLICNPGPFTSIEQAATAEERVNFRDDDLADDNACTESFAALELRRFAARCLGRPEDSIRLASPRQLPEAGDILLLGSRASNPLIATIDPSPQEIEDATSPESFRIHSLNRDGRRIIVIEGKGRVGTLYGTYAVLERMGMRFFGLDEPGTVYPAKTASLPDDFTVFEAPKFLTRGLYACAARGNEPFFLWMARNRMNFWIAREKNIPLLKKLGLRLTEGGHEVQSRFLGPQTEYPYDVARFQGDETKPSDPYPPSDAYLGDADKDGRLSYAEVHPEWYALHDGARDAHKHKELRFNYCTSNEHATRELARNVVAGLIDGDYREADMVDFMMLDHGPWCECEPCREQGNFADRMLRVQNAVCHAIQQARREGRLKRNVQLASLAYMETLPPPSKPLPEDFDYDNAFVTFFPISRCYAHPLADPSCTEINLHTLRCYEGWTGGPYRGSMLIGEYYNVSSLKSLPVLYPRIMAADIPWYYRTGARHLHYMHTPTSLWGTWTLNQVLLARLLWNPETDVQVLLDDYFSRYYPTTAKRMRRFYERLEYAMSNCKAFKHHVWLGGKKYHCLPGKLDNRDKSLFVLDHLHYEAHRPALNDAPDMVEIMAAMSQARREIDDALLACADAAERARLIEDERRFAYGEAMVLLLYHLARTQIFDQRGDEALARHEFVSVERQAERLRQVVDLVQVAYRHANAKDGLDASQAAPAYEFYRKKYGVR